MPVETIETQAQATNGNGHGERKCAAFDPKNFVDNVCLVTDQSTRFCLTYLRKLCNEQADQIRRLQATVDVLTDPVGAAAKALRVIPIGNGPFLVLDTHGNQVGSWDRLRAKVTDLNGNWTPAGTEQTAREYLAKQAGLVDPYAPACRLQRLEDRADRLDRQFAAWEEADRKQATADAEAAAAAEAVEAIDLATIDVLTACLANLARNYVDLQKRVADLETPAVRVPVQGE